MSDRRERAYKLLENYLRHSYTSSGLDWEFDNSSEIRQLTDLIFDEIEERCQAQPPADFSILPDQGTNGWQITVTPPATRCKPTTITFDAITIAETGD